MNLAKRVDCFVIIVLLHVTLNVWPKVETKKKYLENLFYKYIIRNLNNIAKSSIETQLRTARLTCRYSLDV